MNWIQRKGNYGQKYNYFLIFILIFDLREMNTLNALKQKVDKALLTKNLKLSSGYVCMHILKVFFEIGKYNAHVEMCMKYSGL